MEHFAGSDESGDVSSTPLSVTKLIVMAMAFFFIFIFAATFIDNSATHNEHDQMVNGVKRGLKLYSQTYSKSTDAMKTLGEGYLIAEDQEYAKAGIVSNPVQIDPTQARANFLQLVADNMPTTVSDVSKMNFYVIQITTNFSFNSTNQVTPTYSYKFFKMSDGTEINSTGLLNSIDDVQNGIEATVAAASGVKVNTNLGSKVNQQIHKTITYGTTTTFADLSADPKLLGTTMNTFVCIGVDIPIKARFGVGLNDKKVNVVELQSYATGR